MAKKYVLKTARVSPNVQKYKDELNEEQYEAVMHKSGPALVIAGAGSGKTRVVTYRVAKLLESGIKPENIMLVTFTNKAAKEMLHRVELLVSKDIRQLWGGTYHHIANRLLRKYAELLGYKPNYTILDTEDSVDLLSTLIADLKIDPKEKRFPTGKVLQDIVSFSNNTETEIAETVIKKYPHFEELIPDIEKIAEHYSPKKLQLNVMDYDDLLLNWRKLLQENETVRNELGQRFQHVLVDEYQDSNVVQADIIEGISSVHRNVFIVGDDGQSIYSFRGANFQNIIRLPEIYEDIKIYKLESNYRSVQEILSMANACISHNTFQYPKNLRSIRGKGEKPMIVPMSDAMQQSEFVAQKILELRDEDNLSLDDIAVLYRSHWNSMELQMEFTRRGIPFVVRSGQRFFEQRHIKDVAACLRIIVNPYDEICWKRAVKLLPKIGDVKAKKIFNIVSQTPDPIGTALAGSPDSIIGKKGLTPWRDFVKMLNELRTKEMIASPQDQINKLMDTFYTELIKEKFPNYRQRIEDIKQLGYYSTKFENTEQLLTDISLMSELTGEDVIDAEEDDEKVTLSSVHQAKGLEWSVVFMIWCADGRFPVAVSLKDDGGEEEERRLFYVACTRAKNELYLCYPQIYHEKNQQSVIMKPSRFIKEIEAYSAAEPLFEHIEIEEEPFEEDEEFFDNDDLPTIDVNDPDYFN